jgi:HWE histidine kinase
MVALSATDDLIIASHGREASIRDILSTELRPYELSRISLDGPNILLPPNLALLMTPLVHELAKRCQTRRTVLPAGKLSLSWSLLNRNLSIDWRESGVPTVGSPSHRGFGSLYFLASRGDLPQHDLPRLGKCTERLGLTSDAPRAKNVVAKLRRQTLNRPLRQLPLARSVDHFGRAPAAPRRARSRAVFGNSVLVGGGSNAPEKRPVHGLRVLKAAWDRAGYLGDSGLVVTAFDNMDFGEPHCLLFSPRPLQCSASIASAIP